MDFTPRWENNQEHSPCSTRHQPRRAQRQQGKQDVEFSAGISASAGCAFHHAHSSAGTLTSLPLVLHPAGDIALTSPTPREPRTLRAAPRHPGAKGRHITDPARAAPGRASITAGFIPSPQAHLAR